MVLLALSSLELVMLAQDLEMRREGNDQPPADIHMMGQARRTALPQVPVMAKARCFRRLQ